MERPIEISVVAPARDAARWIGLQLDALAKQTFTGTWEIIVADNGSTDDTADVVRSWQRRLPNLRLVSASEQPGANYARNAGVRATRGNFVLFCDADDVASPTWVEAMATAAETADFIGGPLDLARLNSEAQRVWTSEPDGYAGVRSWKHFLPVITGANFGVRAELLEKLGGFDPTFRRAGDEVEFSWRACLAGHPPSAVPDAVVHYRLRPVGMASWKHLYWYGKAEANLYRKFAPLGMPRRPLAEIIASWGWSVAGSVLSPLLGARLKTLALRVMAKNCGRLVGSVQARTVYV